MENDEKYSLDGYSEHQRENWAKSDIIIYEDETHLAVSAYGIRKIFKRHGYKTTEESRGQRAITEDEFYRGRPVIKFIKTINGRTTIVSYASKKSYDLRVQTMYSGKESGALATVTDT